MRLGAGNVVVSTFKRLTERESLVADVLLQVVLVEEGEGGDIGIFFGDFDEMYLDEAGKELLAERLKGVEVDYKVVRGSETGFLTMVRC